MPADRPGHAHVRRSPYPGGALTLQSILMVPPLSAGLAVAFGFTPSLIINLSQNLTTRYMSEIKSTQATSDSSK